MRSCLAYDADSAVVTDLHPLSLEDALPPFHSPRSKADYYQKHLFLRIQCHALVPEGEENDDVPSTAQALHSVIANIPRSSSPAPMDAEEGVADDSLSNEDEKTMQGTPIPPSSKFSSRRWGSKKIRMDGDVEAIPTPQTGFSIGKRITAMTPLHRTVSNILIACVTSQMN